MSIAFSSITKKIWMSLFGLFLIIFLVVHLGLNLLLIIDPTRDYFNIAADFMGTNPFIQAFQWVLFAVFALHMILGIILQIQNWMARPKRYKVKGSSEQSFFSKFMIHTGIIIIVFLIIHFANFFLKAKLFHEIPEFILNGKDTGMEDMGLLVYKLFEIPYYVIGYVIALLILGFHLIHAFQSAFQSLGLNHPKYTPIIKWIGYIYSIVITLGFISIPLFIYFTK